MNDTESELAELRKISAWTDRQRKLSKWALIFLAVFIPVLIVSGILVSALIDHQVDSKFDSSGAKQPDWYEVAQSLRLGEFDKAIRMGEALTRKTPLYDEAHRRLAEAYLAAGELDQARKHYHEAYRLFPSEENAKLLNAVEQRYHEENSGSTGRPGEIREQPKKSQ